MAHLSNEEKDELIKLSRSAQLKNDFQIMKKNQHEHIKRNGTRDLDNYIKFLTSTNAFAGHRMKPFKKIEGENFKL
jgi:hypothetical protein